MCVCAHFSCSFQAKLVARVLSGRVQLPEKECMDQAIQAFYQALEDNGLPIRYTHSQAGIMPEDQWKYNDSIGKLSQSPRNPAVIIVLKRCFAGESNLRQICCVQLLCVAMLSFCPCGCESCTLLARTPSLAGQRHSETSGPKVSQ